MFSVAVLLVALAQVELEQVGSALLQTDLRWFLAAALVGAVTRSVVALRWRLLLLGASVTIGRVAAIRLVFLADLFGMLMPVGVGPDAFKLVQLRRMGHRLAVGAGTLLADRVVGASVMAAAGLLATVAMWERIEPRSAAAGLILACTMILFATVVVTAGPPYRLVHRIAGGIADRARGPLGRLAGRIAGFLAEIHSGVRDLARRPDIAARVALMATAILGLRVVETILLFRGLGVALPLGPTMAVVPLIFLLGLIPISFFGLGLRELSFVMFFSLIGVDESTAFSGALLRYGVDIVMSLGFGGAAMLLPAPAAGSAGTTDGDPEAVSQ